MMADHCGCWSRQHVTTDCFQRLQPCFFSGTTLDASILDFIALCSPVTGAERLPGAPKRAHPRHIVPSLQPSAWQRNLFVYKNRSFETCLEIGVPSARPKNRHLLNTRPTSEFFRIPRFESPTQVAPGPRSNFLEPALDLPVASHPHDPHSVPFGPAGLNGEELWPNPKIMMKNSQPLETWHHMIIHSIDM